MSAPVDAVIIGRDTAKVVAQMRQYVHEGDGGDECRTSSHVITTWANTVEQDLAEAQKEIARLREDVDRLMPLAEAVGACNADQVPESVYVAWSPPSEYQRTSAECGARR